MVRVSPASSHGGDGQSRDRHPLMLHRAAAKLDSEGQSLGHQLDVFGDKHPEVRGFRVLKPSAVRTAALGAAQCRERGVYRPWSHYTAVCTCCPKQEEVKLEPCNLRSARMRASTPAVFDNSPSHCSRPMPLRYKSHHRTQVVVRKADHVCAQYFGNKPQQTPNPNVPSQHGGLQSDVSAPHGAGGGYAPDSAPQAFVNQQARFVLTRVGVPHPEPQTKLAW